MGQLVDAMVPHCENTSPKEQEASARIFPFPAAAATKGRGRQSSACKQRNQGSLEVQGDMRCAFSQCQVQYLNIRLLPLQPGSQAQLNRQP